MSKRSPLRVEYASQETEADAEVQWARLLFIEATRKACPEFLRTLSTKVFPLYRRLKKSGSGQVKSASDELRLDAAISKWAAGFNADRAWIKDDARDTLELWEFERHRRELRWAPAGVALPLGSTGPDFEFRHPGWLAGFSTWPEYKEALLKHFKVAVSEYKASVRKRAESAKLKHRGARRPYSPQSIEWLVLHEFVGLSTSEIAKHKLHYNLSDPASSVRKGIRTAAKLVGWGPLRKAGK